ncbi:Zeatin O-glucosyltransferase [Camellia lanceoleosa]|uniref:Zeatin O-glucosyltransferase n=1 Tax=Camellia lanceoleosa TaxID=1840588 RepID=A0ACC0GBA7_9ERIC|nr:Zeatin O-glucosyltransferase [Camellia lanceoleosa]
MDVHDQHPSHNSKQAEVVVIMVPFPCYSHLNQVLQLSCLISSYNIPVHYACSATDVHQAKLYFNGTNRLSFAHIHFHEFPTPPFLSPPPDPNAPCKFPSHLQPSFEATLLLRDPVAQLLHKISPTAKRVVVVHDALMAYVVQDTATIPNIETCSFNPTCTFSSLFDVWQMMGKPFQLDEPQGLPSVEGCYDSKLLNFITLQIDFLKSTSGTIINSSRSIEGTYIDLEVQVDKNKQIWAVGPLNTRADNDGGKNSNSQHKCLEWLDKQEPKSVLYVSFGTTTSLTNQQIKELAIGLEQSGQKFIWVLRDADKGDIFTDLQGGVVASSTIAEAVKKLMASREGEEMRKKAEELGVATRKAVEEGGVSRMELDSFIAHITR